MNCLNTCEIEQNLKSLSPWRQVEHELVREVSFHNYLEALPLSNAIAELAESHQHHPDLWIGWRKLRISLTTHSSGGITQLDFDLAHQIEALIRAHGKS